MLIEGGLGANIFVWCLIVSVVLSIAVFILAMLPKIRAEISSNILFVSAFFAILGIVSMVLL